MELFLTLYILIIGIPLTKLTTGLIKRKELELLGKKAIIVNIARGEIIEEESLYTCLKENIIAGAAIDVYDKEPPTDDPLLALNNVIVTPHMAGITEQVVKGMDMDAALNIIEVLNPSFRDFPERLL